MRRTLMQRDRELADFEVDLVTGEARIIEVKSDDLAASAGLAHQDRDKVLTRLIGKRAISLMRTDANNVLAAFGAKSPQDLAFRGHGLSLSDQFWYRAPGATDCWGDINFFDNGWDPDFGAAVLSRDYDRLAKCSIDVPEATTPGHAVKAWERTDDGIFLVKAAVYSDGSELAGVKLAADLCAAMFGEGYYVPVKLIERHGRPCSVSPLMLDAGEELADGNRLFAMAGMQQISDLGGGSITAETCNAIMRAYKALGVADASAHVARMASFACLAMLQDFNPGNFGIIRTVGSDVWRAAPVFDYDGSFGFPFIDISLTDLCKNPMAAELFCVSTFSFLDPSWDWSWYEPRALEGFEERILGELASSQLLPSNFAELIAHLFVVQREYVNKIAWGQE